MITAGTIKIPASCPLSLRGLLSGSQKPGTVVNWFSTCGNLVRA
jgi:hypothetical protein